jgi:hypothetical protein
MAVCRLHSSGSEKRQVVVIYEYGNELSGSIKCRQFLNQLMNLYPFKKGAAYFISDSFLTPDHKLV